MSQLAERLGITKLGEQIAATGKTCKACHGEDGAGNGVFPRIADQHADYIVKQLSDFKARRRTNDAGNMTSVSNTLNERDIENLAHYLTGL